MQLVPIQPVPSQQLQIVLGGQNVQIAIYQRSTGLYMDVNSNGTDISIAVLAHDIVPMVPTVYYGFLGNLIFVDTQGSTDPVYSGLGTRYQLLYLTSADYESLV